MDTGIYYFSATGNSLVVARDLARDLGGADLIPIAKALRDGANSPYARIGIVFPVYMFGLPLVVSDFLKALKAPLGAQIFAVATFGGMPGRALELSKKLLRENHLGLSYGAGVLMPGNYTPLYGAISQEKQSAMFEREGSLVKEIAEAVKRGRRAISGYGSRVANLLLYLILYRGGSSQIRESDKKFWVTEECTKCGICERVCPVNNIKMVDIS